MSGIKINWRDHEFNPLPIGTLTEWGTIRAIGSISGERYYWCSHGRGDISMIPASLAEPMASKTAEKGPA